MAEIALTTALVLIFFSIVFGIIRLVIGPDTVDRVVAIDLLTIVAIAVIALLAHIGNRYIYLDVALVYGLLSFLGVLAVARFLEKGI
ncbi:MAG: cation:proton antiporter [Gammaproteobacteria bacterium]|jgi:multicomponent Na+:H+ antiporter subunit F|nr:cation:proton antiporter [Gammaproteobacteria bacterium]